MNTRDTLEKISVIIPVYNAAPYLRRCLDSILNNTFHNLEVICVNDGSQDDSLTILEHYHIFDDRIVVLNQKNSGVSAARNKGLAYATGKYVAFVDSDDWVNPQYFEYLLVAIGNADISHCEMIRANNDDIGRDEQPLSSIRILDTDRMNFWEVMDHCWGKLFRRDILANLKFQEGISFGEDKLFTTIAIQIAKKIALIDNKLYYYFDNPNSAVNTVEHDLYPMAIKFLEDAYKNKRSVSLRCAFTGLLSYRYISMFKPDADAIRNDCNQNLEKCRKLAAILMPVKERLLLNAFARCEFLYRAYRIVGDRTMITWEKSQKQRYTKSER
ncbi:MAG: glycosyltransferase family 2 protein [Lachnospiraceae bacterium]